MKTKQRQTDGLLPEAVIAKALLDFDVDECYQEETDYLIDILVKAGKFTLAIEVMKLVKLDQIRRGINTILEDGISTRGTIYHDAN